MLNSPSLILVVMGECGEWEKLRIGQSDAFHSDGCHSDGCHSSAARRVLVEQLTESVSINTVVVISCTGWCYGECLYCEI